MSIRPQRMQFGRLIALLTRQDLAEPGPTSVEHASTRPKSAQVWYQPRCDENAPEVEALPRSASAPAQSWGRHQDKYGRSRPTDQKPGQTNEPGTGGTALSMSTMHLDRASADAGCQAQASKLCASISVLSIPLSSREFS